MESSTPGFVDQLKGILALNRYTVVIVFVDHHKNLTYIHLQNDLTYKDTLEVKKAFEIWSASLGVKISNYHAGKCQFADKAFMQYCAKNGQLNC